MVRILLGHGLQQGIAGDMAVEIVDRLEMIEIDHQQRDRMLPIGASQQGGAMRGQRTAIEKASQRIHRGERNRPFLGHSALGDLGRQMAIAVPAEQHQGNVEQYNGDQQPIDTFARSPERRGEGCPAGQDEEQHRGDRDASGHAVVSDDADRIRLPSPETPELHPNPLVA